jgi:hypothetical protein
MVRASDGGQLRAKLGLEPETIVALGLKGAAQDIVADYPFPQPLFDGPDEERRERDGSDIRSVFQRRRGCRPSEAGGARPADGRGLNGAVSKAYNTAQPSQDSGATG